MIIFNVNLVVIFFWKGISKGEAAIQNSEFVFLVEHSSCQTYPLYSNEEVRWMTMSESCRKDIEMADWVGREIAKNLKWRERELTNFRHDSHVGVKYLINRH